jgi:hypothetical protein
MKVVGVVCIVVWSQHNIEGLTRTLVNVPQEGRFFGLAIGLPVIFYRYSGAIGQYEGCNIYSIGAAVLAESSTSTDVTAGVGADVLYSGDRLVEMPFGGLLESVVAEDFPTCSQSAR